MGDNADEDDDAKRQVEPGCLRVEAAKRSHCPQPRAEGIENLGKAVVPLLPSEDKA